MRSAYFLTHRQAERSEAQWPNDITTRLCRRPTLRRGREVVDRNDRRTNRRPHGLSTFLPHRDNPDKTPDNTLEIFRNDRDAIDRCDLVVANLNGVTTDDGTAWEIGYAIGIGRPVIGLFTDWRRRFADEVVNLMIEHSVERIVRSLEELDDVLHSRFDA